MIQAGGKEQVIEDQKTLNYVQKETQKISSKIALPLSHEILLIISNKSHSEIKEPARRELT